MKKTIGGDRLGSGSKMQVDLHGYGKSNNDLGYLWMSSMSVGTVVPFMKKLVLAGDDFDIDLNAEINTQATAGACFGSMKMQLDVFIMPIRPYNPLLQNDTLDIGRNMKQVFLPQIKLFADPIEAEQVEDLDNAQINPSCLLKYLGISGIGLPDADNMERSFNATPILMYWDVIKNYYANKQEEIAGVIHQDDVTIVENIIEINRARWNGTGYDLTEIPQNTATTPIELSNGDLIVITYPPGGVIPRADQVYINVDGLGALSVEELTTYYTVVLDGEINAAWNWPTYGNRFATFWKYADASNGYNGTPKVEMFDLKNIDTMREKIISTVSRVAPFIINEDAPDLIPYKYLYEKGETGRPYALNTQEGLAVKTYNSDLFNNWISTEWIDGTGGITETTSIDVTSGSFSIDQLTISKKMYNYLNRVAISGGTYADWQEVTYDHEPIRRANTPMYLGGLIKEIVFQEITSNAEANGENGTQPLGTVAGKGILAKKHKGGKISVRVSEASYIMGVVSITPRLTYSQGNDWDMNLTNMDELHKPALDEIGFQELITDQMAWWDTTIITGTGVNFNSAGKQPAWTNYRTSINQTFGNFAMKNNEMYMTLNRRYEYEFDAGIKDLTTYIDPAKFNYIFADTRVDAQNFRVQIAVDIFARRTMSNRLMPNL